MSLSRKEFLQYMRGEKLPTTVSSPGKADWDAILKELKKTRAPIDIATIQKYYVKDVVTRFRTKNKLEEWWKAGKCLRLVKNRKYIYLFAIPKDYKGPPTVE